MRRLLDGCERSDPLLQLEDDPLGSFLANPRNRLEERRVLADDRAVELGRGVARDNRERHLRADAGDREELLEELPLGSVGKAVQLERVLADVQVGLDDDLDGALRLLYHAGCRVQPVADATNFEDKPVRVVLHRRPAEAGDHRWPPTTARSGGASAWQIATASASAAWCGRGSSESPSTALTIRCIWSFSARP